MGRFQKHPRVFIEKKDIHPVQIERLATCESCRGKDVSNTRAKGQDSVSDTECIGSLEAGKMGITEKWLDTENIDSINLNVQDLKYIHSDIDINSRPPIRGKEELKEMFLDCFSGIGTFKDYKYHTQLDPKVKPAIHPQKIA